MTQTPTNDPVYPPFAQTGMVFPVPRGPYGAQRGVHMANWIVEADHAKLQDHLDRYVNSTLGPAPDLHYRALLSYVMVTVAQLEGYVVDNNGDQCGYITEHDLCFWVPAVAMKKELGVWLPSHLIWFLPYILVDDGVAVVTGRETFGFPKAFGRFPDDMDLRSPGGIEIMAMSIGKEGEPPQPDRKVNWERLFSVEPQAGVPSGHPDTPFDSPAQAAKILAPHFAGNDEGTVKHSWLDEAMDLSVHLIHPESQVLFVKQHRAAEDTQRAGFQAVIETGITLTNFNGGGFFPEKYRLRINPDRLRGYPITENLGLRVENGALVPKVGFWVDATFDMVSGTVKHRWPPLTGSVHLADERKGCLGRLLGRILGS